MSDDDIWDDVNDLPPLPDLSPKEKEVAKTLVQKYYEALHPNADWSKAPYGARHSFHDRFYKYISEYEETGKSSNLVVQQGMDLLRKKYPESNWYMNTGVTAGGSYKHGGYRFDLTFTNKKTGEMDVYRLTDKDRLPVEHLMAMSDAGLMFYKGVRNVGFFNPFNATNPIGTQRALSYQQLKDRWEANHVVQSADLPYEPLYSTAAQQVQKGNWGKKDYYVLDFETYGRTGKPGVAGYGLAHYALDKNDGTYKLKDIESRYYHATEADKASKEYEEALAVNHLDTANVDRLRNGAGYARFWDEKERERLLKKIGNSPLVSYNGASFDFNILLGQAVGVNDVRRENWYDLLHLAEAQRGKAKGRNTLDKVYKDVMKMTMEARGLEHHDPASDVVGTGDVWSMLMRMDTRMGKAARFLMENPGFFTVSSGGYGLPGQLEEVQNRNGTWGNTALLKAAELISEAEAAEGAWTAEDFADREVTETHDMLLGEVKQYLGKLAATKDKFLGTGRFHRTPGNIGGVRVSSGERKGLNAIQHAFKKAMGLNTSEYIDQEIIESLLDSVGAEHLWDKMLPDLVEGWEPGGIAKGELMWLNQAVPKTGAKPSASIKSLVADAKARLKAGIESGANDWQYSAQAAYHNMVENAQLANDWSSRPVGGLPAIYDPEFAARQTGEYQRNKAQAAYHNMVENAQLANDLATAPGHAPLPAIYDPDFAADQIAATSLAADETSDDIIRKRFIEEESERRKEEAWQKNRAEGQKNREAFAKEREKAIIDTSGWHNAPFKSWQDFSEDVRKASRALNVFTDAVVDVSGALGRVVGAQNSAQGMIAGAGEHLIGEIPGLSIFKNGWKYGNEAMQQFRSSNWLNSGAHKAGIVAGGVGRTISGAALGFATGGVGGAIGGAIPGIVDTVAGLKTNSIVAKGNEISGAINLWAMYANLIFAPLKVAANGLRLSFKLLTTQFMKGMNDMASIGLPLTSLTGHAYPRYQYSTLADRLFHQSAGSNESSLNQMENTGQALYGLGQVNTQHLVSASLLGQFANAYAADGNTEAHYNSMVNDIAAQVKNAGSAKERARLMYLAGNVDSTLPAKIQQMINLGISDYGSLMDGSFMKSRGMYFRAIGGKDNPNERNEFELVNYEWGGAVEQFKNSRMRITKKLWDSWGKTLVNAGNEVLDMFAKGDYRGGIERAKEVVKSLWDKIKEAFNNMGGGEALMSLGSKVAKWFGGVLDMALPTILRWGAKYVGVMTDVMGRVAEAIKQPLASLITQLGNVSLRPEWKDGELTLGFHRQKANDWQKHMSDTALDLTDKGWDMMVNDATLFGPAITRGLQARMVNGKFAGTVSDVIAAIKLAAAGGDEKNVNAIRYTPLNKIFGKEAPLQEMVNAGMLNKDFTIGDNGDVQGVLMRLVAPLFSMLNGKDEFAWGKVTRNAWAASAGLTNSRAIDLIDESINVYKEMSGMLMDWFNNEADRREKESKNKLEVDVTAKDATGKTQKASSDGKVAISDLYLKGTVDGSTQLLFQARQNSSTAVI